MTRKDNSMVGAPKYERTENDFYPTEAPATQALIDYLKTVDLLRPGDKVLEPACGDGAIVKVALANGYDVVASDLFPQMDGASVKNYLTGEFDLDGPMTAIITNPPYAQPWIDLFIARTISLVKERGFVGALLMRNEVDAAVSRRQFFEDCPQYFAKLVLNWRPRWIPGSTGSPRHNYAWYIWQDGQDNAPAQIRYAKKPK